MDLINAKTKLAEGTYTCVLCKGEKIYTSESRGVKPLVSWYMNGAGFKEYSAADKVVGKATAFLYRLLGVSAVYAGVISRQAIRVLSEAGISVEYGTLVDNIINRRGDGICPFEAAVLETEDEQEAYLLILDKMRELGIK